MASLWQKTLFYLGLVDEDESEPAPEAAPPTPPQSRVRTVEPPGSRATRTSSGERGPQVISARPTPGVVAGRRVEPPARQRRRVSSNPEHAEAGLLVHESGAGGEGQHSGEMDAVSDRTPIIEARTFSDAQVLADHIRNGRPVVLDLRGTEPAMVRRLVDFSTGLTYALEGRMAKTAQGVILVTPRGEALSADEQRRLADLGLYRINR